MKPKRSAYLKVISVFLVTILAQLATTSSPVSAAEELVCAGQDGLNAAFNGAVNLRGQDACPNPKPETDNNGVCGFGFALFNPDDPEDIPRLYSYDPLPYRSSYDFGINLVPVEDDNWNQITVDYTLTNAMTNTVEDSGFAAFQPSDLTEEGFLEVRHPVGEGAPQGYYVANLTVEINCKPEAIETDGKDGTKLRFIWNQNVFICEGAACATQSILDGIINVWEVLIPCHLEQKPNCVHFYFGTHPGSFLVFGPG